MKEQKLKINLQRNKTSICTKQGTKWRFVPSKEQNSNLYRVRNKFPTSPSHAATPSPSSVSSHGKAASSRPGIQAFQTSYTLRGVPYSWYANLSTGTYYFNL